MNKTKSVLLTILILASAGISMAYQDKKVPKMKHYVIETVTFKSKTDVHPTSFQNKLKSLDEFLKSQPGFISRELGVDEKGHWIEIVHWIDVDSAKTAAGNAMNSNICLPVFALMDEKSVKMSHASIVHRFQN